MAAAIHLRRITIVCAILLAATLFSWESAHAGVGRRTAASAVIVVAFVKIRLVGLEFMELRSAPLPLRLTFEAWAAATCLALLGIYWSTPAG